MVETTEVPDTTVPETTAAPETTVVETTVPETTAPETTVPETTVPETTVPETTVPETTEAPETTVPETTVVETTAAPDTTLIGTVPASVPAIPEVLPLSGDGLGLVVFGADPDGAIAAVTELLGAPTEDTGWADPLTISACPGTQVRRVSWGALSLFFGDESPVVSGTPHLFAYSYGAAGDLEAEPAGLATDDGIGLGSTVAQLEAAYPDVVIEPGEEGVIEPSFFVDDTLSGRLTGGADDDLVTVIIGGDPCGV
jgi:hypothetical protein